MPAPGKIIITENGVGVRVGDLRRLARRSQADLASAVGLTRIQLANIETGRTVLGFWTGWNVCRELNINQAYLATGAGPLRPFLNFNPLELETPITESSTFLELCFSNIGREIALRNELLDGGDDVASGKDILDSVKTGVTVAGMSATEVPTWPQLKKTVARLTTAHGQKAALAAELGVSRQVLGNWLSADNQGAPNAELTLRLLKWVRDPKRQAK